jgi:L-asparaginase
VFRAGAEEFTPQHWLAIARAVERQADNPRVSGVVVTHGTVTAEETAYFLALTVRTAKPIVLACAQRKFGAMSADGDRNLFDALRVASDERAHGMGVLLTMNEEIHSAREVTKTSQRPGGFSSSFPGPVGSVEADQVTFYRTTWRRHTKSSEFAIPPELPRVDIVAAYAGADGVAVDAFVKAGARGIVVNGFSYSGKPHPHQLPALHRAVAGGVPVVLVNRGGRGRVPIGEGGAFVYGDNLTAQKARILLSLGLLRDNPTDLQRIFNEY